MGLVATSRVGPKTDDWAAETKVTVEPAKNCRNYHVFHEPGSYDMAKARCAAKGLALATVTNQEENDALKAVAEPLGKETCGDHVWMGLKSSKMGHGRTEGTWRWEDGTAYSFENWGHTQQDGGGSAPICGGMYVWGTAHGSPGSWFDHSCAHWFNCYACGTPCEDEEPKVETGAASSPNWMPWVIERSTRIPGAYTLKTSSLMTPDIAVPGGWGLVTGQRHGMERSDGSSSWVALRGPGDPSLFMDWVFEKEECLSE